MEKSNLKIFFIKLIGITFSIIIIINVVFNLLLGDKIEKINNLLSLDKSKFRNDVKDKIRNEIRNGLDKENILNKGKNAYYYAHAGNLGKGADKKNLGGKFTYYLHNLF